MKYYFCLLRRHDSSIGFGAPVRANMRSGGMTNAVVASSLLETVRTRTLSRFLLLSHLFSLLRLFWRLFPIFGCFDHWSCFWDAGRKQWSYCIWSDTGIRWKISSFSEFVGIEWGSTCSGVSQSSLFASLNTWINSHSNYFMNQNFSILSGPPNSPKQKSRTTILSGSL